MRPDGKRRRVHATKEQLAFLEAAFQACPKPNSKARIEICKSIRMNTRSVQVSSEKSMRGRREKKNRLGRAQRWLSVERGCLAERRWSFSSFINFHSFLFIFGDSKPPLF
jgi:hypothetical protein